MASFQPSFPGKNGILQRLRRPLSQWLDRHQVPESGIIMFTALIVGIGAGLGAVVFRRLIEGFQSLAYDGLGGLLAGITPYHLLIIPAVGGLIFGPLIYFFAREAKGHGVPEVMEAVALRGGRIRPRVAIVKSLASAICIGTGGSVGREGPIAQIGSALGSMVGQAFNLSDERVQNLVACGAAGGIAATFNAPIAGSIFALEVILGRLHAIYFGAVVISAVTADVIAQIFEGNLRAFTVPEYTLVSPWELPLYALLGVIAAGASVGFTRLLYLSEDLWDKINFPEYFKPVLGGVLLGAVGILTFKVDGFPRVFGVGYNSITDVLFGNLAIQVTLALLIIKVLATIITLGSGGSGGIFAPSLFMGAMLGAAFGQVAHLLFPNVTAPSGAYALVGMAAFFTGAAHAPVTAILILFEMTGDYHIILPLMLTTVISTIIARAISQESIYTLKLSRRGIHLQYGQDIDVMQGVTVGEAMTTEVDVVFEDMPLTELAAEFARTHHHGFPVLNQDDKLVGVVSIQDLERALARGPISGLRVVDIATTTGLVVARPDEPMWLALRRLGTRDLGRLPVVDQDGSGRLLGVVRRSDIIRAYNHAIVKRAHHQHRAETLRLDKLDGAGFVHVDIPAQASIVGRRLSEIQLPKDCLIVSVRRGRKLHVAHGYTVLQEGDRVTAFADHSCVPFMRQKLTSASGMEGDVDSQSVRHRKFTIPAGAFCSGQMIEDLLLPPECIIVGIQRDNDIVIPHGDTVLQSGDVVEILGVEAELSEAESYLARCR
jgi:CIC family chloride channel protein